MATERVIWMSDFEKVEEQLLAFIKEMPTLNNMKNEMVNFAKNIDETVELKDFESQLIESYKQFEDWLTRLFEKEEVKEDIVAFNFGLFENGDGIQLYISGSNEWEVDDENWASNNDYFPEGRYPNIELYKNLYNCLEDNLNLGVFLTISSTIIFANTYLLSNPSKFPKKVVLATGFDDGDLYNFFQKNDETVTSLFN